MMNQNFSNRSEQSLYESLVQATNTAFQEQVKKSTPLDVVTWISRNYYIPETNFLTGEPGPRPIDLVQYHKDVLREANRKDENGLFEYVTIVWSDIKKSAKSSIAAAYALYMAEYAPWGEIYLIANDLKQADSRVAKYARRAVSDSPYLQPKYKRRGYSLINEANNAMIEALPIDPEGEAGSNADGIFYSELWGAADDAKSRMWTEMTLSPTKFRRSQRVVESYAGYKDTSEVLYNLWEMGVKNGELLWPDKLYPVTNGEPQPLELYVNREARLLCLWNTMPRCPWQTSDYYRQESTILMPDEFARMHRNQWITTTDTFIPIEWWDACRRDAIPEIDKRTHPCILSMDAAVSDDTFGLLLACRHPDRENYPDDVVVLYAKRWIPPLNGKINFTGTPDNPGPELEMLRLIEEYNVVEVAYDETQLYEMASRHYREGVAWFKKFNQGAGKDSRIVADSALRDKIRDRRIWHDGNMDLREHLQNSDAKVDPEDRKIRIVKRTQRLKIDLAICLSMAAFETQRLNL